MKVLLALAAYNEERGLPRVLERFRQEVAASGYSAQVVVVDDGSTDGTGRVIEEWSSVLPIELIRHPGNRGLGESIQDALNLAVRLAVPQDVIVSMDADNSHSPELIGEMVRRIEEGNDVVIASRYRPGARVVGLGRFRHLMSYGARFLFQVLFPIAGVRDYTCAFRAYRARIVQEAFQAYDGQLATERGFASMAEILLKLRRLGARMCEVPMVLRYDRKGGSSKMKIPATIVATLRLMARNRLGASSAPRPKEGRPRRQR
jgi:dolichol-phosphate mannosyltransferase